MESSDRANPLPRQDDDRGTVVLQPHGSLSGEAGVTFQNDLDEAINHSAAVIVDLLWVDRVDDQGIAILIAGMKRAQASGKSLAFLAMDGTTRAALDTVWEQQRAAEASPQTDWFTPEFEQFLGSHKATSA